MSGIHQLLLGGPFGAGVTADPYFDYTTLLLPGNGTNGAQNNTFLDSSTNAFSITRNGNTTQGTFSPFSQTGWSNYFNASNTSNIKVASQSAFNIGTGNFTVEFFVNFDTWSSTYQRLFMQDTNGGSNFQIGRDTGSNNLFVVIAGSTPISYSWTPNVGQWYHIALVRSGTGTNQLALYIDGSSVATGTSSGSISQQQVIVGGLDWASDYQTRGYISNFRYSNIARTITVPTSAYTSDANTLLLTCQSNRFVDNSSNAFAITVNGSTSVQAFSPFNPTAAWSASTNGGSGYFDGTGDYLSTSTSQIIPTGSFTIEAWVYTTQAVSTIKHIVAQGTGGDSGRTAMGIEGSLWWFQIGGDYVNAGTPVLGQWNYVAMTFNGSTIQGYVNGVSQGSVSHTGNSQNTTLTVGTNWNSNAWNGYIASVRISNTVRTVTTVPTAPFADDANTKLLLNFTNAGIYDATAKNDLETVGNAQISNTTAKWGSTSIYFDGNGDSLLIPRSVNLSFNTGDFTVEGWVYSTTATSGSYQCIFSIGYPFQIFLKSGNIESYFAQSDGSGYFVSALLGPTSSVSNSTWTHFAIVRYGTTFTCYVNGVGGTASTGKTESIGFSSTAPYVGTYGPALTSYQLTGYIQDLRITKGIARYTQNFTPPTAAFPLF